MRADVAVVSRAEYETFLATHEPASAAVGREIFEGTCAKCHGLAGQGDIGPKIAGSALLAQPQALETLLRQGGKKMPAVGKLWSDDQMKAATDLPEGALRWRLEPRLQPYRSDWKRGRVASWLTTVDHKRIGILYIATSLVFFGLGGILALLMRAQLATPNEHFVTKDSYNELFTMHGTTMIFLVIVPILAGFGNFLVPLMIGARDMAFPRLNAFSYWMFLLGGIVLYSSWLAKGGAPKCGWTCYAPLSENSYSPGHGIDLWILSLHVLTIASLAGAINFIATIVNMRAPGMSWMRMPLFVWAILTYAAMLVLVLPALSAG